MKRLLMTGMAFVFCMAAAIAEEDLTVLGGTAVGGPASGMMKQYLTLKALDHLNTRKADWEKVETEAEIAAYQKKLKTFFEEQLGGFPERTPLNARITGTIEKDGYACEKVIYESRPGFFVTACLFKPATPPPWPGVIVPCGHSGIGKACEAYQRACVLLAQHGMAAFIYDPTGQGERYFFFNDAGKPVIGTTLHHTIAGTGAILTGSNQAFYFIWDGMRAIDYLQSRDDIIAEKIGCTGNSGGGTLTSYIMALDDRVVCAAPSCYLTSFEKLLTTIGPQDAEQDIYGQLAFGMNHADYIHMRAPRPTCMLTATHDFFDIEGSWDTFREAKRFYGRLGYPERVDLVEIEDKHGFSRPRREAAVQWLQRWLLGRDAPVREEESEILTEEEIQCTEEGQVIRLPGAVSEFDLNIARMEKHAAARKEFWKETAADEAVNAVRLAIGARSLKSLPELEVQATGTIQRDGYTIQKLGTRPERGIILPALLFLPETPATAGIVYCHPDGKAADAAPGGPIETLVRSGNAVLAPDLRGTGETRPDENAKGWDEKVGHDWRDFFRAYLIGKSYTGMRAEDILNMARLLRGRLEDAERIALIAHGQMTVPALHAAALERDLFAAVRLGGGIPSWEAVARNPRAQDQLIHCVHGALTFYDLPDLMALLPAEVLDITDAHVPVF
jgi:dienelactone hydrolase